MSINIMSDMLHHIINMSVPYLSSFPYFSDTRVMIAFTALLHLVFTSLSTKFTFKFGNKNIIVIKYSDPYGQRIMKYIFRNHVKDIADIRLITAGKHKEIIDRLKRDICVTFEKTKIYINIEKNKNINSPANDDGNQHSLKNDDFAIFFKSYGTMEMIKNFIEKIANENCDVNTQNTINAHYIKTDKSDKKDDSYWINVAITTNKELKYVFVSETIQKEFNDRVREFMKNEQFYKERGMPYKKTFLLHGPPGCGKTSLIKATCVEYNIPVFIFDMGTLTNDKLIPLLFEVNNFIKKGEKYVILLEDFDRIVDKILDPRANYYSQVKITLDCLLNFLDGIDESYGKLTFITANDISKITSNTALCRPGRIDHIVEITHCDKLQISNISKMYKDKIAFDDTEIEDIVKSKISPSKLFNVLNQSVSNADFMEKIKDPMNNVKEDGVKINMVVNNIRTKRDREDYDIEKLLSKTNTNALISKKRKLECEFMKSKAKIEKLDKFIRFKKGEHKNVVKIDKKIEQLKKKKTELKKSQCDKMMPNN
jgi:ATP-dependent 26S proteasome regulatory subunit